MFDKGLSKPSMWVQKNRPSPLRLPRAVFGRIAIVTKLDLIEVQFGNWTEQLLTFLFARYLHKTPAKLYDDFASMATFTDYERPVVASKREFDSIFILCRFCRRANFLDRNEISVLRPDRSDGQ